MADGAERGLEGRVVDEHGEPLAGLVVEARDVDALRDDPLGRTATDVDGRYALHFVASAHDGLLRDAPDVGVTVRDRLGARVLAATPPYHDRRERVVRVPDVVVPRRAALGFSSTLGGGEPSRLTVGNEVEVLWDDAQFEPMLASIRGARRTLHLAQLLFRPDFVLRHARAGGPDVLLADELVEAARRGVLVRILLNQNLVFMDDLDKTRELFAARAPERVRVRGLFLGTTVVHAKLLVADDEEAFVVGPPFQRKFWDGAEHRPHDPRRGRPEPYHDHTVRLRGPIVSHVAEAFSLLWNERGGEDIVAVPPPPAAAGPHAAQLVRTLPRFGLARAPDGERGLLEGYLRALAAAERLFYVENQYFTSRTIVDAIARALDATPTLEVVLLLNEHQDVPGYDAFQRERLEELAARADADRVGAFMAAAAGGPDVALRLYLHSKLAVADDRWMSVGTANLDSVSLEALDEPGVKVAPSNVDVNVNVLDGADGHAATGLVRRTRAALWSHWLGRPATAAPPPEGWLALWRRVAAEDEAALVEGRDPPGRVYALDMERPLAARVKAAARR